MLSPISLVLKSSTLKDEDERHKFEIQLFLAGIVDLLQFGDFASSHVINVVLGLNVQSLFDGRTCFQQAEEEIRSVSLVEGKKLRRRRTCGRFVELTRTLREFCSRD